MAEAAVYREKLRHDATAYQTPEHLAGAALMPVTGATGQEANIPRALTASPTDTERLRTPVAAVKGLSLATDFNILGQLRATLGNPENRRNPRVAIP
jgi:hypothetical protein